MKKFISLLVAFVLCIGLVACRDGGAIVINLDFLSVSPLYVEFTWRNQLDSESYCIGCVARLGFDTPTLHGSDVASCGELLDVVGAFCLCFYKLPLQA